LGQQQPPIKIPRDKPSEKKKKGYMKVLYWCKIMLIGQSFQAQLIASTCTHNSQQ